MKNIPREKIIFWSIILLAAVLRLWNYWDWSFTHDELGAFVRLNYDSFSDLVAQGVRDRDTHPAFVQVLIFCWGKVFGLSEASIRLPFVLAGIGSVALVYGIAKKWFGLTPAYFSSLTIAVLGFPILYSQLARPYSFGIFFSLLAVWCWTDLLFGDNRKIYLKAFYYGAATVLCMLTHYFSFFLAMLVALTGFLFLKKETWKPYLLSGIIAAALFLPHLSVSLEQFKKGGVGEWLAKPESDYLWKFIQYAFNDSPLLIVVMTGLLIASVLIYHLYIPFSKFQAICLAWFVVPFAAGYYYSVHVNPVLQYSTLLFSFPFLVIFLFSFFKEHNPRTNTALLASTCILLLYSTILEAQFYSKEVFGVFKEINTAVTDLHKKYGAENITTVLNTSNRDIFDFYFKQKGENVPFEFRIGDEPDCEAKMLKLIDSCKTDYFLYGWSNFRSAYEIPEMIRRKFPCILYDDVHFNSQVTLFGKNDSCKRPPVFFRQTAFEQGEKMQFTYDETKADTSHIHSGKRALNVESANEFCITLKAPVKNVFPDNTGCVNVSGWIFAKDTFNAQLVMDVGQVNTPHDWQAKLLHTFVTQQGVWQEFFATIELPKAAFPDDEVTLYLWNPGKNSFYLDDFTVSSFIDSKYDPYRVSYRK